jgi:hypothetical protein
VGPDTIKVRQFVERYRFPGSLSYASSMQELGLGGWSTPLWLLVDSTSTIVLASGIRRESYPYPLQVLQIGRALKSCGDGQEESSR